MTTGESDTTPQSPRIESQAWGTIEVEGQGSFKDVKLFPGGAREWDWGETGTSHIPGIQMADVEELLEKGAEVVILSQGMLERLQVRPEIVQELQARNVQVHVLPTQGTVRLYNEISRTKPVGALIHSTC
ncbi:MAG: Mth938-like domain-containing protein [Gemmatimonadetes bacterium]|nr:Mth938-like domain-containing protein [Gemmatimonadota bacterium]